MVLRKGNTLRGGQYEIETVLGEGGFGITYKAWDRNLKRWVVLKTQNKYLLHDPDYERYVQLFLKEGEMMAQLTANGSHPNLVQVLDLFSEPAPDGASAVRQHHYLVMPFIEGENLFGVVKRRGRVPEATVLTIARQIGSALDWMHQHGFVHRDAHPGNIMLRPDGNAVLIDLGGAKECVPSSQSSTGIVGNRGFAPYEQMLESEGIRQPSADIFCFSGSLYFVATSQRPASALQRKNGVVLTPPRQLASSISKELNQMLMAGLEFEAENRPQSMDEFLSILKIASLDHTQKVKSLVLSPGDILRENKYEIQKILGKGKGAFGLTYKAWDRDLKRHVAIKSLRERLVYQSDYENHIKDFQGEGVTMAKLASHGTHPHLIQILDQFSERFWDARRNQERSLPYLVMNFIDGENLSEAVERQGHLSESETRLIAYQIGSALEWMHQHMCVHLDAHPGNIMLRPSHTAVLIDLGGVQEVEALIQSSMGMRGHKDFSPYEQQGKTAIQWLPSADIFCFAGSLYFAVTGQRPVSSLKRKLSGAALTPPRQLVSISEELNQMLIAGLELEAADRPQTIQEFLAYL